MALFFSAASAQEVLRPSFGDAPSGTLGLGGAARASAFPYLEGGDEPLDFVPLYLYEGGRFRLDGTSAVLRLLKGDRLRLDVLGRYRFTHFDPGETEQLAGLEAREQTVEGGLRATLAGRWGELEALWVADILGEHDGQQTEITYRHRLSFDRWTIAPWLSVQWLGEDVTGYYFGVSQAEADASAFDAYAVGGAVNSSFGVNSSFQLTPRMSLFGNFGATRLDERVAGSPIVAEKAFASGYMGLIYMFGDGESASVAPPERNGEWSWRINGGYQAQGGIVGEISTGSFAGSADASTHIAGLTGSRLVMTGRRLDFFAKLAAFRHFEDELQDNFFSYSAYMMAHFKGYSAVSQRESFRFGFGYGLSYASTIPVVEQRKQERRGRETSHLLNYLELSVDFPVRNLLKVRRLRDCYVGVTLMHRSGIFGVADILGNVSGGSDWITGHLECRQ